VCVIICYFLKSIMSVFIVQCNASLSKNYVAHSQVEFLKKKNRFVCALLLSVQMKSVLELGFFHKFAFDNKALETFVKFRIG